MRPISSGSALPVFAFFAAGVNVVDGESMSELSRQPVVAAIVLALVFGKLIGVLGATALVTALTPLRLPDAIGMRDLLPVGFLTGIGFHRFAADHRTVFRGNAACRRGQTGCAGRLR